MLSPDFVYLISLASLPVVAIFTWIYLRDRGGREPIPLLVIAFVLGGLGIVPAILIELNLSSGFTELPPSNTVDLVLFCFIVVAFTEELIKYIPLRYIMFNRSAFDEPFDGIMYSVAVSLGFAFVENIFYVFQHGVATGWLRAFSAVPGHAMWAVLVGYYIGLAKFESDLFKRKILKFKALFFGTLCHGLYDLAIFSGTGFGAICAIVLLVIQIGVSNRAVRLHREASLRLPTILQA